MNAALALLPSAVVLVAVLGFRVNGIVAAALAAVFAVGVWLLQAILPAEPSQMMRACADAGVLTALVAGMIVPGILFVEATRETKSPEAVRRLVDAIGLDGAKAAILIAAGIGVMVESLTGMGVSLLVTMPLLLRMFERRAAIGIGLVGMSLMPWGALSISAHVAAKLSGVPLDELQIWIASVSGPVAFMLPLLVLLFVPRRSVGDGLVALLAGAVLVAGLWAATVGIGVEVAGVAGGLAVIVLMAAVSPGRAGLSGALLDRGLLPYLMLLVAVVAQKLGVAPLKAIGFAPALDTGRVRFELMTSPGVALLAAVMISAPRSVDGSLLVAVAKRSWRPMLAIALFMFSARVLIESGAIGAMAQTVGGLGRTAATVVVALLGAVGGFVTGSGVTGNALFMPSASAAGTALGILPVLAALQNGASGHVGMASLPVGAILLAALGQRSHGDEAMVMRTALALAAWHVVVATVAALALTWWLF